MSATGMAVGYGNKLLGVLLAAVLNATIAFSEWPLLTRLRQYWVQRRMKAAGRQPYQTPPDSQAPDNPPAEM